MKTKISGRELKEFWSDQAFWDGLLVDDVSIVVNGGEPAEEVAIESLSDLDEIAINSGFVTLRESTSLAAIPATHPIKSMVFVGVDLERAFCAWRESQATCYILIKLDRRQTSSEELERALAGLKGVTIGRA